MLRLSGIKLPRLPLSSLRWIADLEYFEGPLVSHFVNDRGGNYLKCWMDVENDVHRWMIARVGENDILRLANRIEPLDQVLPVRCQDDFVYFLDAPPSGLPIVLLVPIANIPPDYAPETESFLRPDRSAIDERSFPVLIDSDLEEGDLSSIPRAFIAAYDIFYILSKSRADAFVSHPWKDGYSSMWFYREIAAILPPEDRASVKQVQYSSPGFIRFSLDRSIAELVSNCVQMVGDRRSDIARTYTALGSYIVSNGLNSLHAEKPKDSSWRRHNSELVSRTKSLLNSFGVKNPDLLIDAAPDPFEAAKIARSIVERLKVLERYQRSGTIQLPRG